MNVKPFLKIFLLFKNYLFKIWSLQIESLSLYYIYPRTVFLTGSNYKGGSIFE